jgi:hypothetical protein
MLSVMSHTTATATGLAAAAVLAATGTAGAAVPCDYDLDGDGTVGIVDFLDVLAQWGTDPGGPPDFDGDGTVGILDFLDLLAAWGPIAFDYGPPQEFEARQIGLEMLGAGGALVVPDAIYDRIVQDLQLIRSAAPGLATETHAPAWLANEMIVQLDDAADQGEYLCLNETYGVTNVDNLFADWWVITLGGALNVPALATIYMQADAVTFAEPNGLIGGQNYWVPTDLGSGYWRWEIDDGFHDCFDGCDCHRLYTYRTDANGNVQLLDYEEFGAPWCEF